LPVTQRRQQLRRLLVGELNDHQRLLQSRERVITLRA
jgi:hypothetical protein